MFFNLSVLNKTKWDLFQRRKRSTKVLLLGNLSHIARLIQLIGFRIIRNSNTQFRISISSGNSILGILKISLYAERERTLAKFSLLYSKGTERGSKERHCEKKFSKF